MVSSGCLIPPASPTLLLANTRQAVTEAGNSGSDSRQVISEKDRIDVVGHGCVDFLHCCICLLKSKRIRQTQGNVRHLIKESDAFISLMQTVNFRRLHCLRMLPTLAFLVAANLLERRFVIEAVRLMFVCVDFGGLLVFCYRLCPLLEVD
jgi:hypothetical protein